MELCSLFPDTGNAVRKPKDQKTALKLRNGEYSNEKENLLENTRHPQFSSFPPWIGAQRIRGILERVKRILNTFDISYDRYARNAQLDFKLAISVMAVLLLYQLLVILHFDDVFHARTSGREYLFALLNGLRYNAVAAGYFAAIPFCASLISFVVPVKRLNGGLREFFMLCFALTAAPLLLSHFLYFMEFKENFTYHAVSILYDDAVAVVLSAWRYYPLGKGLVFSAGFGALYYFWARRFIRKPWMVSRRNKTKKPLVRFLFGLLYLLAFIIMIRGSFGLRPVEPKDCAVTSDNQLNNQVVNPYLALLYAVQEHLHAKGRRGVEAFLEGDTIRNAVNRYFHDSSGGNLDAMMVRSAPGAENPPKHIFLILMESMDAWDLLEKYRSFKLLPNLESLGKRGILIKDFLSASSGTMTTLAAILTGLPDAGVVTNYQANSSSPYPTSLAPQFQRLGYRTRFFYGGYLSWQRLHDFCVDQGFEEIYGGGHMGNWRMKEWGVDDHVLFDFVLDKMKDSTPSFNVILSTSNHSPYDIDVYQWGFPYKKFPDELDARQATDPVRVFGHLWYSDKVLGDFIRSMHAREKSSLFAVTGDHRSHIFLRRSVSKYEKLAVPLLIYGQGLAMNPAQCDRIAGSHMDIGPTLVELSAPKGFRYCSLGSSLLDEKREQVGFGRGFAITPFQIVDMKGASDPLPSSSIKQDLSGKAREDGLARRLRDYYAIGWWRIMKGPELQ